jgi:hypothetical protein
VRTERNSLDMSDSAARHAGPEMIESKNTISQQVNNNELE